MRNAASNVNSLKALSIINIHNTRNAFVFIGICYVQNSPSLTLREFYRDSHREKPVWFFYLLKICYAWKFRSIATSSFKGTHEARDKLFWNGGISYVVRNIRYTSSRPLCAENLNVVPEPNSVGAFQNFRSIRSVIKGSFIDLKLTNKSALSIFRFLLTFWWLG